MEALHKDSISSLNKQTKKPTKGTGIVLVIVRNLRKQDKTLIMSINPIRCKSLTWGISYLKFISVNKYINCFMNFFVLKCVFDIWMGDDSKD